MTGFGHNRHAVYVTFLWSQITSWSSSSQFCDGFIEM